MHIAVFFLQKVFSHSCKVVQLQTAVRMDVYLSVLAQFNLWNIKMCFQLQDLF